MRIAVYLDNIPYGEIPPDKCPACDSPILAADGRLNNIEFNYHSEIEKSISLESVMEKFRQLKIKDYFNRGYVLYKCMMHFEWMDFGREETPIWTPSDWESTAYCRQPKIEIVKKVMAEQYGQAE